MAEPLPRRFSFYWDGSPLPLHYGVEFPNGDRVVHDACGTRVFTRAQWEGHGIKMVVFAWLDAPASPVAATFDEVALDARPIPVGNYHLSPLVSAVVRAENAKAFTPEVYAAMEVADAPRGMTLVGERFDADAPHVVEGGR